MTEGKNREKKIEKNIEQDLKVIWDDMNRSNICVIRLPEETRKNMVWKKKGLKKHGWKCHMFGERHVPTNLRSTANPKQDKITDIHAQTYHTQISEAAKMKENSWSSWRETIHYLQENNDLVTVILSRNCGDHRKYHTVSQVLK